MANMIDNQLEVRGLENDAENFVRKAVSGSEIELFNACADVENPYLFDQHVEKLAFGLHDLDNQSRYLYYFRTKWSAPIGFVKSLSMKYTALDFALHYYDLCGGSCYGDFEIKDGIVRLQNNRRLDEITAYELRRIDGSMNKA